MPRRVCEFELGADADAAEVLARVVGAVPASPERVEDRVLVDTFDGRLHRAGLVRDQTDPIDGEIVGNRALAPVVRIHSQVRDLTVLNGDEKIVVRLQVVRPQVIRTARERIALPVRVVVQEVLGYVRAYERTHAALQGVDDVNEPEATLFEAASRAVGRDPAGTDSKVRVPMSPESPAGVTVGALLARLAEIAQSNVPGTIDDLDVEFLHDLRVAVRRARSVLRELPSVFPPDELAHVRAELKWVQAATGPVRDLDVQLEDLDDLARGLDDRRRTDLEPLRGLLRDRRVTALADLRSTLKGRRFGDALVAWRDLARAASIGMAGGDAERPVQELAARRIRHVHRRMLRDGSAIGAASASEELHDLRKRGKELRYLLELFGALFPAEVVKPLVKTLKDLQDVLGRFQDRAVQAQLLEEVGPELGRRPGGPPALMALGLVVQELRTDQVRAREAFGERFAQFAAKEQRSLVKRTFR